MKWTRKGLHELFSPDGKLISRHTDPDEAAERAFQHAQTLPPGTHKYLLKLAQKEIEVSTLSRVVLLSAPSSPSAVPISSTRIDLSWTAVVGAASYRVYRGGTLVASPTGTTSSQTGLSASTQYSFQIATVNADGLEGPRGSAFTATTLAAPDTTAPTVPVIAATAVSPSSINVTLTTPSTDAGTGLASYTLERATNSSFTANLTTEATGLSIFPRSVTGLSSSTTYYFRARATDVAGNSSANSATVSATTQSGSGVTDNRQSLVLLEDFATWRMANNGNDRYFDVYNGAVGDAGPNQVCNGVSSNALNVSLASNDVYYVDADCAPYTNISHWMQGHIKSGTWNSSINRMSFLLRCSKASSRNTSGSSNFNVGTYTKPRSNLSPGAEGTAPQNGHHFYHDGDIPLAANRWRKIVITNCPQHERGDAGSVDHNVISNYFEEMTRFYIQHWGIQNSTAGTMELARVELWHEPNPCDDNNVRGPTIQYTGTRYEVTWQGRKNVDHNYDVRARTDGVSMREAGFESGTLWGTTSNPGNDYTGCFMASPDMSESANGVYVAIRRTGQSEFHEIYLPYQVSPTNTTVPAEGVS